MQTRPRLIGGTTGALESSSARASQRLRCLAGSALRRQRGFSLIELLVVMLIGSILATAALMFLSSTTNVFNANSVRVLNQDDARTAVGQMTRFLRMATDSADNGTTLSNAVITAQPQDVEFYCDLDGDGVSDKVRYYLSGNILMMQSEAPTWTAGPPARWVYGAYDTDGIVIENRVRNEEEPLFTYYRQGTTGLEACTPTTDTLKREVVAVGIRIRVGERPDLAKRDVYLSTQVQIRQRYTGGLDI